MKSKIEYKIALVCLSASLFASSAQSDYTWNQLPIINLDALVITGTRQEVPLIKNPVSISVVDRSELELRPSASVADHLRSIPGVFIADNTLPGMQRLRIRGEDARRSLVLVDGHEISDHSTFGPPLLMDSNLIESVEVVKGPHSTLYGSRAMGGVINIRTRKPDHRPVSLSASSTYNSATRGHRESLAVSGAQGSWSYMIAGSNASDDDRETPIGRLADTSHESSSLLGQVAWTQGSHEVKVIYDKFDLSSEANTRDGLVDGFIISNFKLDFPARGRERIGLSYDGQDLGRHLRRLSVNTFGQTNNRNIVQEIAGVAFPIVAPPKLYDYRNEDYDTIDTIGANLQTDWSFSERHSAILGFNYLEDDLDKTLERRGTLRQGPNQSPVSLDLHTEASIETQSVYGQSQWSVSPQWQFSLGLRHYQVTSKLSESNDPQLLIGGNRDSHTLGSAALVYNQSDSSAFRLTLSEGYVYPTLLHLHTGSLFGQGNLTRPNPFLKPETSTNYEIGYRIHKGPAILDLSLFGSDSENYIASVRASSVPELGWAPNENTYTNLDTASAKGVELDFEYRPAESSLSWYLRGTWLKRKLDYARFSTYDNGQPELRGTTGIRFHREIADNIRLNLDGNIAGGSEARLKTSRSTRSTDSWTTVNLSLGLTVSREQKWWLGLEAFNLTDELYRPSVDELYQAGRSVSAKVGVEF